MSAWPSSMTRLHRRLRAAKQVVAEHRLAVALQRKAESFQPCLHPVLDGIDARFVVSVRPPWPQGSQIGQIAIQLCGEIRST